jgi:hypothetical protein
VSRRTVLWIVAICVAVALLAAGSVWWSGRTEAAVRRAVTRYDLALADTVQSLDPETMGDTVTANERQRIANYLTLLFGRGVRLESSLLDVEIVETGSGESTVTATVVETWRYRERDIESGEVRGEETVEEQTLRYLFVREGGRLVVDEVVVIEGGTGRPSAGDSR